MQSKAQNDEGVCAAENSKVNQLPQHLLSAAEGCRYLYLWLDCDREGENICFEVISILRSGKTQTHLHPSLTHTHSHTHTHTHTHAHRIRSIGNDRIASISTSAKLEVVPRRSATQQRHMRFR
jgi:DNA topoisomerase IA